MASMAVLMPTSAMMPNAIMATVMPVRTLLLLTVRKDRESVSRNFIIEVTENRDYRETQIVRREASDVRRVQAHV